MATGKLIFFCGKMAAGKSTLSKQLAQAYDAVLLVQDDLLEALYPGEIREIPDFVKFSTRLKTALTPNIIDLLEKGQTVILDFPGNTPKQRSWFLELIDATGSDHELHLIEASDELCKQQLKQRSRNLPEGSPWTTEAEFEAITAYYQPPTEEDNFNIILHHRTT